MLWKATYEPGGLKVVPGVYEPIWHFSDANISHKGCEFRDFSCNVFKLELLLQYWTVFEVVTRVGKQTTSLVV